MIDPSKLRLGWRVYRIDDKWYYAPEGEEHCEEDPWSQEYKSAKDAAMGLWQFLNLKQLMNED